MRIEAMAGAAMLIVAAVIGIIYLDSKHPKVPKKVQKIRHIIFSEDILAAKPGDTLSFVIGEDTVYLGFKQYAPWGELVVVGKN